VCNKPSSPDNEMKISLGAALAHGCCGGLGGHGNSHAATKQSVTPARVNATASTPAGSCAGSCTNDPGSVLEPAAATPSAGNN
jgi:hypothetical protein